MSSESVSAATHEHVGDRVRRVKDVGERVDGQAAESASPVERLVRRRVLGPLPASTRDQLGLAQMEKETERAADEVEVTRVEDETVVRLVDHLRPRSTEDSSA